jgi:haloalkane dehalogenase
VVNHGRPTPREEFGELYPFDSHYHDVGRGRLHYVDEGSGPAIVMVHGNPTWSFYFRGLVRALRGHHRCIVPDHMGCGWSDVPGEDRYEYTLQSRVEDLSSLLDELGLERVILIVHDWGGMIGSAWATQNPDRVEALVILNTAAFGLPGTKSFPRSLTLARLPVVGEALVRGASAFSHGANRFCVKRGPLPPEVRRAYLRPYDTWGARLAVHRFVEDIPLRSSDPAFALVEQTAAGLARLKEKPMLICWGLQDFIFDEHFLAEWERRFPEARVCRYEDAGHYILEDAFDEVAAEVTQFIEQVSASVSTTPVVDAQSEAEA